LVFPKSWDEVLSSVLDFGGPADAGIGQIDRLRQNDEPEERVAFPKDRPHLADEI